MQQPRNYFPFISKPRQRVMRARISRSASCCQQGTRRSLLLGSKPCTRRFHDTRQRLGALPVESAPSSISIDDFRQRALLPEKPLLFPSNGESPASAIPAAKKWFCKDEDARTSSAPSPSLTPYMSAFQDWPFPYELVTPAVENERSVVAFRDWLLESHDMTDQVLAGILQPAISEAGHERRFFQLYAPLKLLTKAIEFNQVSSDGVEPLRLYIAQSSLSDLPPALQNDLLTPEIVKLAGKGDVYGSSVWLGTEPTYTPLHRDPNPNLFCQLHSSKTVRLLPPTLGERLYFEVQAVVRSQGSSRIRTTEMMEGTEREVLHDAVWANESPPNELQEAELGPGTALFIPKGWWHSLKSTRSEGRLNGSANWWFR